MAGRNFDHQFRLLLVGEPGVGKSCILLRFADDMFESDCLSMIGVEFRVRELDLEGRRVKLEIWYSAGQERLRSITSSSYRNASGIIIVYDVTSEDSFNKVAGWVDEIRRHVHVPLLIVGNKGDLVEKRQVTTEAGAEFAKRQGLIFMETSAKANTNIEEALGQLSKKLVDAELARPKPAETKPAETGTVILSPTKAPKKKKNLC
jgi:small GTP-binding protein